MTQVALQMSDIRARNITLKINAVKKRYCDPGDRCHHSGHCDLKENTQAAAHGFETKTFRLIQTQACEQFPRFIAYHVPKYKQSRGRHKKRHRPIQKAPLAAWTLEGKG